MVEGTGLSDRALGREGATMAQHRDRQDGWESVSRPRRSGLGSRGRKDRRPCVEPLESRRLLTSIAEFLTSANSRPTAIVAGSDGNLWFTEQAVNQVARINPNDPNHAISHFTL